MRKEQWLAIINENGGWDTEGALDDLRFYERSLKWHGLYEQYLLRTWREQTHDITVDEMVGFLRKCNRTRLRAAGNRIPAKAKTVTLYRGVSGDGTAKGISWTDNINIACLFAHHYTGYPHLASWAENPTVYRVTVPVADVLCYTNHKGEREYLLDPTNLKPEVVTFEGEEMRIRKMAYTWDNKFKLRERFVDTEGFLKSQGVPMEASCG